MSRFKLEGGLLKEVPSIADPETQSYHDNGEYWDDIVLYKNHISKLRSYTPSAELLATGKTEWEETDFEVRGESVINQKGPCPWYLSVDSHESALFAYPLDEVKEDDVLKGLQTYLYDTLQSGHGNKDVAALFINHLRTNFTITLK